MWNSTTHHFEYESPYRKQRLKSNFSYTPKNPYTKSFTGYSWKPKAKEKLNNWGNTKRIDYVSVNGLQYLKKKNFFVWVGLFFSVVLSIFIIRLVLSNNSDSTIFLPSTLLNTIDNTFNLKAFNWLEKFNLFMSKIDSSNFFGGLLVFAGMVINGLVSIVALIVCFLRIIFGF